MRLQSFAIVLALFACAPRVEAPELQTFVVASTTSTQDSGLLDALVPAFEIAHPAWRAKVVAVGSGEAMELGRRGDADVLLVHSPKDEVEFMEEGRGVFRKPVMSNNFVIAGPARDPAGVRDSADAAGAFSRIASARSKFLSRGDDSGTHRREIETWSRAGIDPKGSWYISSGQGMAETLAIAAQSGAYLLTDSATFRVVEALPGLVVLFQGDEALLNPYSVIPVKGARHPEPALLFAEWITGSRGQKLIADFGKRKYGASLFEPNG